MYYDLNISGEIYRRYILQNDTQFIETVISCLEDGYSGIAVNFSFDRQLTDKDVNKFKPIDVEILKNFVKQSKHLQQINDDHINNFKQYSRITLEINDTKQLHYLNENNQFLRSYDIIAVIPKDEKIFHDLCVHYDYFDMISFDLSKRIPFILKKGIAEEAVKQGIVFELSYSQAIDDQTQRRTIFSNMNQIINAFKGKNILFTSQCSDSFLHRSPFDVATLGVTMGLKKDQAFNSFSKNAELCIKRSIFRKSYKGTVVLADDKDIQRFSQKEEIIRKKVKKIEMDIMQIDKQIQLQQKLDPEKKIQTLSFILD